MNLIRCFDIPLSQRGRADDFLLTTKISKYKAEENKMLEILLKAHENVILVKNLKNEFQFSRMGINSIKTKSGVQH